MFLLKTSTFPANAGELRSAILGTLNEVFALPDEGRAVQVEGEAPTLEALRIDLSGAKLHPPERPERPDKVAQRQPAVTARQWSVVGKPVHYEDAKLDMDLSASEASFDYGRDAAGHVFLMLTDAKDGQFKATMQASDIELLILSGAKQYAHPKGVEVQDTQLALASDATGRSIDVKARVIAKKKMLFWVTATLDLTAKVDIDDNLIATVSKLEATGEGPVGAAVVGMLGDKLKKYEGMQIPLTAFSLGEVRLRDVHVNAGETVVISAKFGS